VTLDTLLLAAVNAALVLVNILVLAVLVSIKARLDTVAGLLAQRSRRPPHDVGRQRGGGGGRLGGGPEAVHEAIPDTQHVLLLDLSDPAVRQWYEALLDRERGGGKKGVGVEGVGK